MTGELRELHCAGCGAPLRGRPGDAVLICDYCKRAHHFVSPPPAAAPPPSFEPGAAVQVLWGGRWWAATVRATRGPGRWFIHYEGWGDSWDEEVGPDRIAPRAASVVAPVPAPRAAGVLALVAALVLGAAVVGVLLHRGELAPQARQSTPVDAATRLSPGQRVEILWRGSWWPGVVRRVEPDGRVRIHYDNYSDSWDETVDHSRLRLRP